VNKLIVNQYFDVVEDSAVIEFELFAELVGIIRPFSEDFDYVNACCASLCPGKGVPHQMPEPLGSNHANSMDSVFKSKKRPGREARSFSRFSEVLEKAEASRKKLIRTRVKSDLHAFLFSSFFS
jgi:hypothetical protein